MFAGNPEPHPLTSAEGQLEIVAGFNTQFRSMKYSLPAVAEYSHRVTASAPHRRTLFHFGGWPVRPVKDPSCVLLSFASWVKLVFASPGVLHPDPLDGAPLPL
ncbi:MAG: NADH-quinone oxidoreductase subunit H [Holophagaceae bacterium]|uniref:NADH-quinone oxidoreductase subunit H n=1 Tax=Candidatus Geothrix odensensis TaxID=2954440 RepID=A0A936F3U2_9BACT|nr:NADH-quinone oxidoreductase subunit H [Candidatus Geothrix odensensis]